MPHAFVKSKEEKIIASVWVYCIPRYIQLPLYSVLNFLKMNVVLGKTEKLGNTIPPAFLFLVLKGTGVDGGTKPFVSWPGYGKKEDGRWTERGKGGGGGKERQ